MKTIELHYDCRVQQGHRFCKDIVREWPEGATLGDVMAELTTELQSLGCSDVTVTRAARKENKSSLHMVNGPAFKVINDATGELVDNFSTHKEALAYADQAHRDQPDHHFQVYEVVWCGGSKKLADLDRSA